MKLWVNSCFKTRASSGVTLVSPWTGIRMRPSFKAPTQLGARVMSANPCSVYRITPPEPVGVILYTEQGFADITRAPSWVGALNDGRMRIPVQGLTSVTPELARVLKHELTHSFIGQKTHNRAPTWLQEGVAQYMEGRRTTGSAGSLLNVGSQGGLPALASLEGSWMGLSGGSASVAYAWSLAAVESIIQSGSIVDISRLLDAIAASPDTEQALRDTLHDDYSDLQQQAIVFLQGEDVR